MANSISNITPKILAKAVSVLRQKAVMPRLINVDYSEEAKKKGSTIDIPVANDATVRDVSAAATFNTSNLTDISPTLKQITLDQWKEVAMVLTEKEEAEMQEGYLPEKAIEAASAALAENVNDAIFALYKGVYGFSGTPGTTPFATTLGGATDVRKVLNNQKAPGADRRLVLDPDAEANALGLSSFNDASAAGDAGAIREAVIGRKLGFSWYMDQGVPNHTNGSLTDGTNMAALIDNAAVAIGDTDVDMDETSLSGTVKVGDVFTVDGDSQTYTVTADATAATNSINVELEVIEEKLIEGKLIIKISLMDPRFYGKTNVAVHYLISDEKGLSIYETEEIFKFEGKKEIIKELDVLDFDVGKYFILVKVLHDKNSKILEQNFTIYEKEKNFSWLSGNFIKEVNLKNTKGLSIVGLIILELLTLKPS